jgi:hypothetical protein
VAFDTQAHPASPLVGELLAGCWHMLCAVNNVVRRAVLALEVVPLLCALAAGAPERAALHEAVLGMLDQLGRGDRACRSALLAQAPVGATVAMMARHSGSAAVQAQATRVLGACMLGEAQVSELLEAGGLKLVLDACEVHGQGETPQAEALAADATELLEAAMCAVCEAAGEAPPSEELGHSALAALLGTRHAALAARRREEVKAAQEAEAAVVAKETAAAEEATAAEAAAGCVAREAEKQQAEKAAAEAEEARKAVEEAPCGYAGFSFAPDAASPHPPTLPLASSFDDPRLAAGPGQDTEESRIEEVDA